MQKPIVNRSKKIIQLHQHDKLSNLTLIEDIQKVSQYRFGHIIANFIETFERFYIRCIWTFTSQRRLGHIPEQNV